MAFYKPNTIQMEFVQGCDRQCDFCGTKGMERKLHFIKKSVLQKQCELIESSGYNPRILLAGHGENTLHPKFLECVALVRACMPKAHIQILTNGYGLNTFGIEHIGKMFAYGLNDICLDEYVDSTFDDKTISSYLADLPYEVNFVRMKKGVPLYLPKNAKSHRLMIISSLDASKISQSRKLMNHCGAGMPPSEELSHRTCTRLFREMSFRWDGNVAICCNDFRGQYPIMNVMEAETFNDIWLHERFEAARRIMYHKKRIFFPCKVCNCLPMREGLLPDHLGKEEMPKPTKKDKQIVDTKYEALAKIVKRKWEE